MAGSCSGRGGCTLEACCAPDPVVGSRGASRRHRHHRPSSQPRQRGQLTAIASISPPSLLYATAAYYQLLLVILSSAFICLTLL